VRCPPNAVNRFVVFVQRGIVHTFSKAANNKSEPTSAPMSLAQVCVRCGKEYEYDWERMARVRRVPRESETSTNTPHKTAAY